MNLVLFFTSSWALLSLGIACNIALPDTANLPTCFDAVAKDLNAQLSYLIDQADQLEDNADLGARLQNFTSYFNRLQLIKSSLLTIQSLLQGDLNGPGYIGGTGFTGSTGQNGAPGMYGMIGPTGDTGVTGPAGTGMQGATGFNGLMGSPGQQGETGNTGFTGVSA